MSPGVSDIALEENLPNLAVGSPSSQPMIGTLSFPVRGKPIYTSVYDNTSLIAQIIREWHPALLLCAGWSIPTAQSLDAMIPVTREVQTIVLVETTFPTPVYFRIADGQAFRMGEQFFSTRQETEDKIGPRSLAHALPDRSFSFCRRDALLLNCGEVMVVRGRRTVEFHWAVPQAVKDAVRAPKAIILNPTHTRMGNCGTVMAWRKYLSSGERVYVSASNWDVANGQHQSTTLHSQWFDGVAATPSNRSENGRFSYREWKCHWLTEDAGQAPAG